jgi:hypothetical protein
VGGEETVAQAKSNKQNRCWPGYEPVPGKKPNSQGSCRPQAKSKASSTGKKVQANRKKQLDRWEEQHPGARRQAAQHLGSKKTARKSASTAKKSHASAKSHASSTKKYAARTRPRSKSTATKKRTPTKRTTGTQSR